MVPDLIEDLASLRGQQRRKVFQPVEIQSGGDVLRAHLLNLSASGALVHSHSAPAPGAPLRLTLDGSVRTARVVWRDGVRFGIAFALPLGEAEVERVLGG